MRLNALFAGTVQGVGFRATTRSLASRRTVAGFVRNLQDGRVHLVAEGERSELDMLLDEINAEMGGLITSVETSWGDPTGEFDRFEIRR